MATIYSFEVRAVSPFIKHDEDEIKEIIKESLEDWRHERTGMKLESIEVKTKNKDR